MKARKTDKTHVFLRQCGWDLCSMYKTTAFLGYFTSGQNEKVFKNRDITRDTERRCPTKAERQKEKPMKKQVSAILAASMAASMLVACGGSLPAQRPLPHLLRAPLPPPARPLPRSPPPMPVRLLTLRCGPTHRQVGRFRSPLMRCWQTSTLSILTSTSPSVPRLHQRRRPGQHRYRGRQRT